MKHRIPMFIAGGLVILLASSCFQFPQTDKKELFTVYDTQNNIHCTTNYSNNSSDFGYVRITSDADYFLMLQESIRKSKTRTGKNKKAKNRDLFH